MSEAIEEKLDILIKLQAAALVDRYETSKEKVLFLNKSGLKPSIIAELLGTTANYVSVTLSREKKLAKTGKTKAK